MDVALADLLLTTTRSVRKRLDLLRPVEPAVIERAIEVALQAPTGSNSQGWHFVVVTDAEKREYLKKFEAELITPAEAAVWKRGASNAGYHYLGCAKTFALMGKAFAEATLKM